MSFTITDPAEQTCVDRFVAHVNDAIKDLYSKPRVVANVMSDKWIRIEKQEMRDGNYKTGSVYCFIARQSFTNRTMGDVVTGGIYKASSFSTPAKHHRGNIYDNVTFPCAGPYGIAYLPVGRKAAV